MATAASVIATDPSSTTNTEENQASSSGRTGTPDSLRRAALGFVTWYGQHLAKAPVPTKALTSLVGFIIGDVCAQLVTSSTGFSVSRVCRLGLYGLLLDGPVGHLWYKVLDANVFPDKPQSNAAILSKTALDQLLWAPGMTVVFFTVLRLLEGRPEAVLGSLQTQVMPTLLANYLIWPLAHYISFRFIATDYRILYNNCVSIAWITFLSLLANGEITIDMHALALQLQEPLSAMLGPLQHSGAALGAGQVADALHRGMGMPPYFGGGGAAATPDAVHLGQATYESLVKLSQARFLNNPPGPWE